jgi:hypothetical protein
MRKVRDVLRLKHTLGMSLRQISDMSLTLTDPDKSWR